MRTSTALAKKAPKAPVLQTCTDDDALNEHIAELHRGWSPVCDKVMLRQLSKHVLQVDTTGYQRNDLKALRVEQIARAPSMIEFGSLIVGHREDDTYWVVDGQHRHAAAMMRSDIDRLNCIVFASSGRIEEARHYVAINTARSGVTPRDRFRGLLTADDGVAKGLQAIFEELGITLHKVANSRNQLASIAFVFAVAKRDLNACCELLKLTQLICGDVGLHGDLLKTLWYLDTHVDGGIHQHRFRQRLRRLGVHRCIDIIGKAQAARGAVQSAGVLLLGEVNKALPVEQRFMLKEV